MHVAESAYVQSLGTHRAASGVGVGVGVGVVVGVGVGVWVGVGVDVGVGVGVVVGVGVGTVRVGGAIVRRMTTTSVLLVWACTTTGIAIAVVVASMVRNFFMVSISI